MMIKKTYYVGTIECYRDYFDQVFFWRNQRMSFAAFYGLVKENYSQMKLLIFQITLIMSLLLTNTDVLKFRILISFLLPFIECFKKFKGEYK
jgi:hypothetical protein